MNEMVLQQLTGYERDDNKYCKSPLQILAGNMRSRLILWSDLGLFSVPYCMLAPSKPIRMPMNQLEDSMTMTMTSSGALNNIGTSAARSCQAHSFCPES